jgi:pilus assembly protein Flp/PilA
MLDAVRDLWSRLGAEKGASLVEYALLLALIALVCVGALMFVGGGTDSGFERSQSCLGAAYSGEALPEECGD